jgi:hypothetical protein
MNPLDLLPNPDEIGQSEYRYIHQCLFDVLPDCPKEERLELAVAILDEFEGWAKHLKEKIVSSEKPA